MDMTSARVQELIDGAGGHYTALASLLIRHIRGIVPSRVSSPSVTPVYLLFNIVDFIASVDDAIEGRTRDELYRSRSIRQSSACSIASCAAAGVIMRHVIIFAQGILPWATVYCGTVKRPNKAFLEARPILHSEKFQLSKVAGRWQSFATLARARGAALDAFEAGNIFSRKACDNIKCGRVREEAAFKRCSACLSFYYCSSECQRINWHEGGYRAACARGHSFHLGKYNFLTRTRTHDACRSKWGRLAFEKVSFMAAHPGEAYFVLFVLFDYRHLQVDISVHPLVGLETDALGSPTGSAEWKNDVARAVKSDGKLEIHVMVIPEGIRARYLVVPLHTNSSREHATLARLASFRPRPGDMPELLHGVKRSVSPATIETY
ncbi:hypothetical protein B0H19DRAFT_1074124 [Mycena capillaripes]|nr:hypothetical protein B0H19DRAFT_1074124 [Mycena capillaripes]